MMMGMMGLSPGARRGACILLLEVLWQVVKLPPTSRNHESRSCVQQLFLMVWFTQLYEPNQKVCTRLDKTPIQVTCTCVVSGRLEAIMDDRLGLI